MICLPARNELEALPSLLQAISALRVPHEMVALFIYLDGCTDGSEEAIERLAPAFPIRLIVERGAPQQSANAGVARRAAVAMALRDLGPHDGLIFITDADSAPRSNWIEAGHRALAEADVVAGWILRSNAGADPQQSRLECYYDRLHRYRRRLDAVAWEAPDTHHYSSGANLAVRASVYRAIGGFRPLPSGEDATFLDDAGRAGFRVRRDREMVVVTSSRRTGRADSGLAAALRALDAGWQPRVADPRGGAWQWRAQAAARRSYATIHTIETRRALGHLLGLTADHVLGVARDCPNEEAFAIRIVPAPRKKPAELSLSEAENILFQLEIEQREVAA